MGPSESEPRPGSIRITRDEAMSSHVDDLLKRQMSLRGQEGVTRERGRRWYYQNWFVFMIAGTLAASAAWALIEPYFDDLPYLQGKIEQLAPDEPILVRLNAQEGFFTGLIQVKGQRMWLFQESKEIKADGSKVPLDLHKLQVGQTVGVYVSAEHVENLREKLVLCHYLVDAPPPQSAREASITLDQLQVRSIAASLLVFPLVGGFIGLGIGAADGLVCRLLRRAVLAGFVGLLVGFIGAFITSILANLVYAPINALAMKQMGDSMHSLTPTGFLLQMMGRALAWGLAGMAMGLGQGLALRSSRLAIYGFLGGIVGGLLGGLLFDPIDLILLGMDKPSAHWSRLVGFACIGAFVGAMIGIVELLARDSWLRMTEGPLAGKEFLLFKDVLHIGSSPRSDIYLFNDELVNGHHATLRAVGDDCELEAIANDNPTMLNGRPVRRSRLRHGDRITIGKTSFVYQKRQA